MNAKVPTRQGASKSGNRPVSLKAKLDAINERVKRQAEERAAELEQQGFSSEKVEALTAESSAMAAEVAAKRSPARRRAVSPNARGVSSVRLIEQAQLSIFEGEREGKFTQYPIEPGSEFPSILTRVPIFIPAKRSTAKAMLDDDLAINFETGWGKGRKFGPPLTIYDEDTLLALGALRQRQLHGMGSNMPVKVMDPSGPDKETDVQVLFTTVREIEEYLGLSKGGRGHKKRLASVHRLAAVTLEFSRISDPSMGAAIKRRTFNTKLIDMASEETNSEGFLFVQFPPVMVRWLKESYTYIDMDVRRQITSDTGKAIHKYLAGQRNINIGADKLRQIIGSRLARPKFMKCLRDTLAQLESLGWLEYEIVGNGRRTPFKLTGRRLKRTD